MMSEEALREAVREAGIEAPVRFREVTGSTNSTALELAAEGAPEWAIVAAGHQTAGRGRLGRTWLDEAGRSLLFSVVLRPELAPERAGLLSLLAGACTAGACREVAAVEAGCKWPNDLMVRDRKAGGILAEARISGGRIEHVVVGVGVNLAGPPRGLPAATGLEGADAAALLTSFLRSFRDRYRPAEDGFAQDVLASYRGLCVTLGGRVRARVVDGREVEGIAVDLDAAGGLVIETATGREAVPFGEIEHLYG